MKDFDNIEDWYRDELNKFNVEPDKDLWKSLSDDLDADMTLTDENIGEWYKREVNKLEERPDYTVWEKLATKLDTASVWDKLVVSLNRYEQFIWWRNTIIKGSAILLLLGSSYYTYNNYFAEEKSSETLSNNKTNVTSIINQTSNSISKNNASTTKDNSTTPLAVIENTAVVNSDKANSITEAISAVKRSVSPENASIDNSEKTTYASLNGTPKEIHFNSLAKNNLEELITQRVRDIYEIERRKITERDISHIYNSSDFLVKKEKNKIVFNSKRFSTYFTYGVYARRFYFGANAGVKKQGLITSIRKDSPLAQYNQVDYLDFGNNFGLLAGYILSDKVNIEANLNINSTSGYERRFNGAEDYLQEKLNLNYTSLSVVAKKMNTKSTFDNKVYSTNLIGGFYAGYLTSASSDINEATTKLDSYNAKDFGIVLGIEQDRYITKSFLVTPGVRYNQGLINVANDNSNFDSARNFSFEFNLGVKYILLKKSK